MSTAVCVLTQCEVDGGCKFPCRAWLRARSKRVGIDTPNAARCTPDEAVTYDPTGLPVEEVA